MQAMEVCRSRQGSAGFKSRVIVQSEEKMICRREQMMPMLYRQDQVSPKGKVARRAGRKNEYDLFFRWSPESPLQWLCRLAPTKRGLT